MHPLSYGFSSTYITDVWEGSIRYPDRRPKAMHRIWSVTTSGQEHRKSNMRRNEWTNGPHLQELIPDNLDTWGWNRPTRSALFPVPRIRPKMNVCESMALYHQQPILWVPMQYNQLQPFLLFWSQRASARYRQCLSTWHEVITQIHS